MTVLVIAPHPDDEILGCGGVIAKRAEAGDDVWVCIMSEGKRPMYSKEFIKEEFREMQIAHSNVGVGHFIRVALPTARLDTIPQYKLNCILTDIVDTVQPDEVFIPHRGDMHRDHQIVADAAMVALRPNRSHKAKRVLAAFEKTRLLAQGETQLLTLEAPVAQLASYDDLGKIQKSAYVL